MGVWTKIVGKNDYPPVNEEVVILYKDKKDELNEENLYYGIARIVDNHFKTWSYYTEYQGYYEVVYWARLYDMPHITKELPE